MTTTSRVPRQDCRADTKLDERTTNGSAELSLEEYEIACAVHERRLEEDERVMMLTALEHFSAFGWLCESTRAVVYRTTSRISAFLSRSDPGYEPHRTPHHLYDLTAFVAVLRCLSAGFGALGVSPRDQFRCDQLDDYVGSVCNTLGALTTAATSRFDE